MAIDPRRVMRAMNESGDEAVTALSGTRGQTIQRLQIGLSGIAAMVLLVGLASIIMERAQVTQASTVPEAVSSDAAGENGTEGSGGNPLADAGVVPDVPAEPKPAPTLEPLPPPDIDDLSAPLLP